MPSRLRRSDCAGPGLRRVRRGKGFSYLDEAGDPITSPEVLARLRELVIPPAWTDVWICPDERGHLQATGFDAAGRKQYLYHPRWRELQDRRKFERMEDFALALPDLRTQVESDLRARGLTRERVLACAARLLDIGLFRIGSEQYADEDHGVGLATIRRDHVRTLGGGVAFAYPGKAGVHREHGIADPDAVAVIRALQRRSGEPDELLFGWREGRRWRPIRSDDINDYLKAHMGEHYSAKDFRTWKGTCLAAFALALHVPAERSVTARKRAIAGAVRAVAAMLGNTPAVARRSYIDPRVFDRYNGGYTIAGVTRQIEDLEEITAEEWRAVEEGVLDLLEFKRSSAAVEKIAA